jgi:hypothetical protein
MPGIYFIITIFVGITLYLVLSLIWKQEQEQDKQKYGKILDWNIYAEKVGSELNCE